MKHGEGMAQGTVLGPLLCLIFVNDLLVQLDAKGFDALAFADDLTLL